MSPCTFQLISLSSSVQDFVSSACALPDAERPIYLAQVIAWVGPPHRVSVDVLAGPSVKWDLLSVKQGSSFELPESLKKQTESLWSESAEVPDDMIAALNTTAASRLNPDPSSVPQFPAGWSPSDHSELDKIPGSDVEAMEFGLTTSLRALIRSIGLAHGSKPIGMFNLLAYNPGKKPLYYEYIKSFSAGVGSSRGAEPLLLGMPVLSCSSTPEGMVEWEDSAVIQYPSIWHFAEMLDSPEYKECDRKFKVGVLKDNPILCVMEIDIRG